MKKLTALMLALLIALSAATTLAGAVVVTEPAPAWTTTEPDLIITELCPDNQGNGIGGYNDGKDPLEMFEIYNNSDFTLNLYDYCITYNGNSVTNDMYENAIVEITPFLTNNQWEDKPGNYLDGTVLPYTATDGKDCCDLSNLPKNPETCLIEPGEVVVVWCMYFEAYLKDWNDGKGLSIDDFRSFWNIPADVKVIAFDGNSNTSHGGNDKNFNLKNSGCGSYGIAKYSDALNAAANTEKTTKDASGKYGYINIFDEKTYREFEDLVSWINVDFNTFGMSSMANYSYNFTVDYGKGAEMLSGASGKEHQYDSRRGAFLEMYAEPTPGRLTDIQKLTLKNYKFKAGESVVIPGAETVDSLLYTIWAAEEGKVFTGLKINGTEYKAGATFTASAAGKVTVEPMFDTKQETTKPETTKAPEVTTAPETSKASDSTKAPDATKAPDDATKAPETTAAADKKGCGSSVAAAAVAVCAIFGSAVVIRRKK